MVTQDEYLELCKEAAEAAGWKRFCVRCRARIPQERLELTKLSNTCSEKCRIDDLDMISRLKDQIREKYEEATLRRERIFERDGHCCVHCGSSELLQIDHIHPRSKGGGDEDSNLQTLCRACNSSKGTGLAPRRRVL
jgi:5-methylcytosine-specific restriction endonuclease McrA